MSANEVGAAFNAALERLARYLGSTDASEVMGQALRMARIQGFPAAPEDLYRLGIMLEEHDLPQVTQVGVALKVKALLMGVEDPFK